MPGFYFFFSVATKNRIQPTSGILFLCSQCGQGMTAQKRNTMPVDIRTLFCVAPKNRV